MPLSGIGRTTEGLVLCDQPRVLDLQTRSAAFAEKAPQLITDEVIARLLTLLE